jgi:hypothetical protein
LNPQSVQDANSKLAAFTSFATLAPFGPRRFAMRSKALSQTALFLSAHAVFGFGFTVALYFFSWHK